MNHTVDQLFTPEPVQWGLRGDPYLWREMERRAAGEILPVGIAAVEESLHALICTILGTEWQRFIAQDRVYHPDLAHGGMSSGYVKVSTWIERLIPLLLARAKALHDYSWLSAPPGDGPS